MGPQGFWRSAENGYLFSGIWGALVIIFANKFYYCVKIMLILKNIDFKFDNNVYLRNKETQQTLRVIVSIQYDARF